MEFKDIPNWQTLKKRYTAFVENRLEDDCIIAQIQNPGCDFSKVKTPAIFADAGDKKYLDPKIYYAFQKFRYDLWSWHGDLFRYAVPSYGPNVFIGFCGAKVVFGSDSVWHEPAIESLDEADKIHFDKDNIYFRYLLESIDYGVKNVLPERQLALPDLGGPTDWISAVMGTENFLIASIEEPDKMREFASRLARECNEAYSICEKLISPYMDGAINWMPVWNKEKFVTLQDDMAINFSPQMYKDLFMPAMEILAQPAKFRVMHWHDGCAQHVTNILESKLVDVLQFGHDPNTGPHRNYLPQMQQIQAAGVKLFISCVQAADVEFFIQNLNPVGLMMIIDTVSDEASEQMRKDLPIMIRKRLAQLW